MQIMNNIINFQHFSRRLQLIWIKQKMQKLLKISAQKCKWHAAHKKLKWLALK